MVYCPYSSSSPANSSFLSYKNPNHLSTFLTSIVGVAFYTVIAPMYASTGLAIAPDWRLGLLFGIGGLMGMYCGARAQKYFPARLIKLILGIIIVGLALRYISNIF